MKQTEEQQSLLDAMSTRQRALAKKILAAMTQTDDFVASAIDNPLIAKYVQISKLSKTNAKIMSRDEMCERLTTIARTNIDDILTLHVGRELIDMETGDIIDGQTLWSLKPTDDMPCDSITAIAELTATKTGMKVKLHNQTHAMKQIAELQGYEMPKKKEISGAGGGPVSIMIADDENDL